MWHFIDADILGTFENTFFSQLASTDFGGKMFLKFSTYSGTPLDLNNFSSGLVTSAPSNLADIQLEVDKILPSPISYFEKNAQTYYVG